MPPRAWKDIASRTWKRTWQDNVGLVSAGVTYYGFLALVPLIGMIVLLYGVIATLGAVFAGPSSIATRLRRALAPTLNERPGIVWGTVGFIYLLAIWWGGTHALRVWWGILLLAGLIALGVVALRRQTLQEFPSGAHAEPAPAGAPSTTDELARLQEMHEAGAINDEEFVERAKKIAPT